MTDNGPGPNGEWSTPPRQLSGGTLHKEWYAHGPSLFVWVAVRGEERQEFALRREAATWLTSDETP